MWDYIAQFWDALTEVVVSAGTYSVEWFQNIGNAVAGAFGGLFDWIIHYINDFFIFLGWIFTMITQLIKTFTLPISYIFNFLKAFTISAFSSPQTADLSYSFSSEIMGVFEAIPYWNVILLVLAVGILVIIGFSIFRLLLKIT